MSQPKPGDRFSFTYLDEEGSQPHQAIVQRLLSNRDEGLSSDRARLQSGHQSRVRRTLPLCRRPE